MLVIHAQEFSVAALPVQALLCLIAEAHKTSKYTIDHLLVSEKEVICLHSFKKD